MKVQTNRTILFEKINSEHENLLSLIHLQDKKESLSDEEIKVIHRELEVGDFDSFMDKFSPSVYMHLDTMNKSVSFSDEYIDSKQIKIPLGQENSVFWQIWGMLVSKRKRIYSFKEFSQMGNTLLTNKEPYEFDIARNRILSHISEGVEWYELAKEQLSKLIKKNNDEFYLLLVFIHDVEKICITHKQENINRGIIKDNGNLQVRVVETAPSYKRGMIQYQTQTLEKYAEMVEETVVNDGILKDVLLLPYYFGVERTFEIYSKYKDYLELYETTIKRFWRCAKPKLETMFGIKEFFEQQRTASKNAELIIANISVDEVLDIRNTNKLHIYLKSVNSKVFYENTIWYAILPNVDMDIQKRNREIREHFASSIKEENELKRYEKEEVISLTEILSEYKIQTFISMATGQKATFSNLATDGIAEINDALRVYEKIENKDYFIPCFPNFVVVSDSESYIRLGKKISFDEINEEMEANGNNDIWLSNLEVEASYIAAGLYAACQDVGYLSSHFRRGINENNPGVGYRFSEGKNATNTVSDMLSETYEFRTEIVEDIIKHSRGIVFAQHDGKMQILTDRTFSYSNEKKLLVSMVQTITYIERTLQKETQDFKKNMIIQFFQKRPGSVLADWGSEEQNCINPILRQNEVLSYELNEDENSCVFMVDFGDSRLTRKNKVIVLDE